MDVSGAGLDFVDRKPQIGVPEEEEEDATVRYICASVKCRQSKQRAPHQFLVNAHLSQPRNRLFCMNCYQCAFWKPPPPVDETNFKEISTD